jgi:superfamily II DNA or RNA helicase
VKIIQDNTIATVVFDGEPQKLKDRIDEYLYDELSEDIPGAQFSPSVRSGRWDGKSHFYDKKSHSFASGLINRATLVLDKVRFLWEFTYQVVDNRPDSFANEENIRDAYILEKGKFKLRDYQENAVNKIFSSGHGGIVNYGTGTGKCMSIDTMLLTTKGYKSIKNILCDLRIEEGSSYREIGVSDSGLSLINGNMVPENVDFITINGVHTLYRVILENGSYEDITANHPLLCYENGEKGWIPAYALHVGSLVYTATFIAPKNMAMGVYNMGSSHHVELSAVADIIDMGEQNTYDVSMPITHSFIANGIINHNTGVGAAAIKALLPSLKPDERIAMFTNNKEIFRQNKENLEKLLGMKVGYLGGGKKKIAKVMVCMIPTVDSYLKIEPTKGLSYSPKERQIQKMAIDYREKFIHTVNPYAELKSFVRLFRPIKKVDYKTKETLEDILYSCGSNEDVVRAFNQKLDEYNKIVYKKAKEKVDKKKFIEDLLDSFVMFIADECHHSRADTWYNVLLSCRNAVYKVGLSGSIDQDDKLTWARLQGVFGGIIAKLKAKKLIDEGLLAKPTIIMANVESPGDIVGLKKWQDIYKAGIVENEYRNSLIAGLAKQSYDSGKTTLIIVSQIAHSDNISNNLQDLGVPYEVINGTQEDEDRKSELNRVKTGHTRVLIATSVLDEGVDISNIDVLIMAAGGKSMRQAIQRVGRVLRKKKNKENKATIFDFYDDTNRILRNHSQERLDIYEEQEFEIKRVGE